MTNNYHEPVIFQQAPQFDIDGFPVGGSDKKLRVLCRVQELTLRQDIGRDKDGAVKEYRVYAPSDTDVDRQTEVTIRGEIYRVDEPPHDHAAFRRPMFGRHKPSVVFVAKRGEG